MARCILRVLPLAALVSCTRTVAVDSPARVIALADRIDLRSGERVEVDRVVQRTTDSVVVETDGRSRRIAIDDVEAVVERKRWQGMAQGAVVGGGIGAAAGAGIALYEVARECDSDEEGWDGFFCGYLYFAAPAVAGILGALVGILPGAAIGAAIGHKQIYRRKPPLTISPAPGGVRASWTIEF